jgi:hypothetical protein
MIAILEKGDRVRVRSGAAGAGFEFVIDTVHNGYAYCEHNHNRFPMTDLEYVHDVPLTQEEKDWLWNELDYIEHTDKDNMFTEEMVNTLMEKFKLKKGGSSRVEH